MLEIFNICVAFIMIALLAALIIRQGSLSKFFKIFFVGHFEKRDIKIFDLLNICVALFIGLTVINNKDYFLSHYSNIKEVSIYLIPLQYLLLYLLILTGISGLLEKVRIFLNFNKDLSNLNRRWMAYLASKDIGVLILSMFIWYNLAILFIDDLKIVLSTI